jgi:ABC-type uncharacterized transport system permease subunit
MILSFAPSSESTPATAFAMSFPSVVALIAYAIAALPGERHPNAMRLALAVGWLSQGVAIAIDIAGLGADSMGARFGFAPALSVALWLVLGIYALETQYVPLHGARRRLAIVGCAVVALAWIFPGQVQPPAASRVAPLHWLLGIACYGLFGVAVLHAVLLSRAERRLRRSPMQNEVAGDGVPLLRIERLTYRFVTAGFALLSAAIVLGAWTAHPWRWDHKTVFSLLAWIVVAAVLGGRQAFGWRGPQATRWIYVAALLLLLAYAGSRFVFEVLLHRPPVA